MNSEKDPLTVRIVKPAPEPWAVYPGWARLDDNKLLVWAKRIRDRRVCTKTPGYPYRRAVVPGPAGEKPFGRDFPGFRNRRSAGTPAINPETLNRSRTDRHLILTADRKFGGLMDRNPGNLCLLALFTERKPSAEEKMVAAVGITIQQEKFIAGLVRAVGDSERVLNEFLRILVIRRLCPEPEVLCVIDELNGLGEVVHSIMGEAIPMRIVTGSNLRTWWMICPKIGND